MASAITTQHSPKGPRGTIYALQSKILGLYHRNILSRNEMGKNTRNLRIIQPKAFLLWEFPSEISYHFGITPTGTYVEKCIEDVHHLRRPASFAPHAFRANLRALQTKSAGKSGPTRAEEPFVHCGTQPVSKQRRTPGGAPEGAGHLPSRRLTSENATVWQEKCYVQYR